MGYRRNVRSLPTHEVQHSDTDTPWAGSNPWFPCSQDRFLGCTVKGSFLLHCILHLGLYSASCNSHIDVRKFPPFHPCGLGVSLHWRELPARVSALTVKLSYGYRTNTSTSICLSLQTFRVHQENYYGINYSILTNEIIAANNKIFTKRSSNCSKTNCHIDLPVTKESVND